MSISLSGIRFWGPASPLGLSLALIAVLIDQAQKWWTLHVYDLASKGTVSLSPFLDFVLVWNPGVSYGLLPQEGWIGQAVLIAIAIAAVAGFTVWLARTRSALVAASIGLIIGGAIGNAIDRALYGAVADFFSFHAFGFYWYVFNIADAAIVAGVAGLLYDSLFGSHKKVSKSS
ncbi:MAG: signal peptidase II [Pseudomonadota bacterium]|nr:signal peptidase II [Pseudomonadota bacterium]